MLISPANAIKQLPQLSIAPISDSSTYDLFRAIRSHLPSLIPGLLPTDISTMSLGLSHSFSRHKLKFSPDKVDTMIVQAIALLDDLDKELNTYAMRVKEWYGWHFPEMGKILNDNLAYSRVILKMGMRTDAGTADLAEILPEEIEAAVKSAAEVSMGTEITIEDLENIRALAQQVVDFTEYRQQLSSYLSARMSAIAPNLTALVGDLVGARLISHAGSLMNLAKSPASTIQILGAEKALFRALKTKHDTPKYGLLYHASLVGQAMGKNKGKIARMVAAKAAIGLRVDALSDWSTVDGSEEPPEELKSQLGNDSRLKIERRLAGLEGKPLKPKGVAIAPNGVSTQPKKWEVKEARKYNPDADGLGGDEPAAKRVQVTKPVAKKEDVDMNDVDESDEEENEASEVENDGDAQVAQPPQNGNERDAEMEDTSDTLVGKQKSQTPQQSSKQVLGNGETPSPPRHDADDTKSDTISEVSADTPDSPDSPTQQERNWQSSILGNTKEAKKARKRERHARKLALSEERSRERAARNAKFARRLDRKERRIKRAEQILRREERDNAKYASAAKQAGLSIVRYKRKLARGEIKFDADGIPVAISKKEIKKAKKAEERAKAKAPADVGEIGKKRKRQDVDGEKVEKKKKKKSKVA